jgi:hypothetical protein
MAACLTVAEDDSPGKRVRKEDALLARVVTIQVKPEKMDECISIFKEVNAPSIAARAGFDHGHWWVDRRSGKATSVTFWKNEKDEESSRANIPRLVEGMSDVLGSDEVYQEIFEVVHEQHPIERSEEASLT